MQRGSNDGSSDVLPESLTPPPPSPPATSAAPGGDAARIVFGFAPLWVHSATWHCRHPDSSNEQSYLDTIGPHTAEEVSRLYKNRQMKGSNLVVGLASDALPCEQIPASFFRTLGYIFEMAKSGLTYLPVTAADLQRGSPDPSWCPPLWQHQAASEAELYQHSAEGGRADPAEKLLTSSPFWCYLYNHEPSRSKKTPPKTAEEMLLALHSNCLPDWAPLVGLGKDVATFNSLPPCLFMTLSSLTSLVASGVTYKPVGLAELNRYDKFFNSRTKWGSTQGVLQPLPATGAAQPPALAQPSPAVHSASSSRVATAPIAQQYGAGGMYMHQQQAPSAFVPFNPPVMAPNPMMWYGNYGGYVAGQMYPGLAMPPGMPMQDASHSHNLTVERTSAPEPLRLGGSMERSLSGPMTERQSCPLPHQDRKAPGMGGRISSRGDETTGWQTPVFRLFMSGSSGRAPASSWWLLIPGPGTGASISAPMTSEEVILHYASGRLRDHHCVCGTANDVPGNMLHSQLFQPIGTLLRQVEMERGSYALHTVDDLLAASEVEDRQSYPGKGYRSKNTAASTGTRRGHKSFDGQGHSGGG